MLRFVSLSLSISSAAILFFALFRSFGVLTASLAAGIAILSPSVVSSAIRYQSEYPLFLAVAALIYCIVLGWRDVNPNRLYRVGLPLAIGLGLWSKPSFIAIAGPMLVVAYVVSQWQIVPSVAIATLRRAILTGVGIGAVFYVPLGFETLKYLDRSARLNRQTVDGSAWHRISTFTSIVGSTGLGPATTVLTIAALLMCCYLLVRRNRPLNLAPLVVLLGVSGAVPVATLQFLGGNFDARLLGPAVFPLSIAIAVALTALAPVDLRRPLGITGCALLSAQLAFMLAPLRETPDQRFHIFLANEIAGNEGDGVSSVFAPRNEWNWNLLRDLMRTADMPESPKIAYLGNGDPYSIGQIALPWVVRGEPVRVRWLWRYEDGAIDWRRVMLEADRSDVAIVAPTYVGYPADKQPFDNEHNAQFVTRLRSDPDFEAPRTIVLGNIEPTDVFVFFHTTRPGT